MNCRVCKLLWPGPVLFVLFWIGFQSFGARFLRDPGMFWHTRTGEKILAEGFLRSDPYTFTFADTWWVPYQWLGEVGMALLHRISGLDSLLVVSTALIAGLFAWMATKFIRIGLHPIFAIGLILLSIAAASTHFHVRPHLFTLLGMAIATSAILAYDRGRIALRQLWWLVPFFIVWVNIHGGVLGGLSTLGLAVGGWIVWRILGWPSPVDSLRTGVALVALTIACGLTIFMSPYGTDLPKTWLLITGMPRLPELIQEHSRFELSNPMGWPMLALAGIYIALLTGVRGGPPRLAWLLPIAWFVQALLRVRHGSIFAVVATITIIDIWPYTKWAKWLAANRTYVYQPGPEPTGTWKSVALTAFLGLLLVLSLQAAKVPLPLFGTGCARLNEKAWPTEVTDVLREHEPRTTDAPRKLFSDYIDGAFVIYHAPGYRVFVDDRCEVFGDDWLADLVEASGQNTELWMERWQTKYGKFDFALTRTDSLFDEYFRERPAQWQSEKRGEHAAFYRRK